MDRRQPWFRLARKAERAGELRYIHSVRAASDEHEANAVATVLAALDGVDTAVVHLSSMIVVKFGGSVICRVLSEREITLLTDHPELLRSPADLFAALADRHGTDDPDDPFITDLKAAPVLIGL